MPIRFPTEAANADFLGEDHDEQNHADADGTARGKADGAREHFQRSEKSRESDRGEAKPGKDINQAGFVKDKDAPKP